MRSAVSETPARRCMYTIRIGRTASSETACVNSRMGVNASGFLFAPMEIGYILALLLGYLVLNIGLGTWLYRHEHD